MSRPDHARWRRTSPLAALYFFGRFLRFVSRNATQSLAPLAALLFATGGDLSGRLALVGTVALGIALAVSILAYLFFRYRITDDSILVREGVFRKRQLDIKFDRIQAINTRQNVVYRWFGVVTVTFDTAGSAQEEGSLPAIPTALADSLRKKTRRGGGRPAETSEETEANTPPPILALTNVDMVRIGLSDNRAFILLAILGPFSEQIEAAIGEYIESRGIAEGLELTLVQGMTFGVAIVAVVLATLALASIAGAFLRFHRFRLEVDDDVMRSSAGLFTRHEQSIRFAKVQTLEARQGLLLQWFRRFRLRAKQASSVQPGKEKHFAVPLCTAAQTDGIGREIFGDEFRDIDLAPTSAAFRPIHHRYLRARILIGGVLPALFTSSMCAALGIPGGVVFLAWIPLNALGVWIAWRKFGYIAAADGMVLRRGLIGYRVGAFLYRKVQRIGITQTISQRRRGLATLRFYLASGTLKLPYVDHRLATEIRDYVLYRVESGNLAWH
ncbi:MAG: PH domain-containing protein [Gammaproteobacteria bacterium]|nr:PH domain-containing protein [Gammaproteobacteria bacterium]